MITNPNPSIPALHTGPCGEPCEHPCDEASSGAGPCDKVAREPWAFQWLKASLFNALDLCFDDVYREPKRILIVGGCRQIPLAQHLALLLPAADITLVDSDETVVQQAKEAICCRFRFVAAPLEALPFEADDFDLTIAHNLLAYPLDWKRALSELGRVTERNLFISTHRPWLWSLADRFQGVSAALRELGATDTPPRLPERFDWMTQLNLYARIKTQLAPFPWTVYMTEMRPLREERLTLS